MWIVVAGAEYILRTSHSHRSLGVDLVANLLARRESLADA